MKPLFVGHSFFSLINGSDKSRRPIYVTLRRGYIKTLDTELITHILELAKKYFIQIRISFNTNLMNGMTFCLDEYSIFHATEKQFVNWGNEKQFLLDLIDIPGMRVTCTFNESFPLTLYRLGKDGVIVEEDYIPEELGV